MQALPAPPSYTPAHDQGQVDPTLPSHQGSESLGWGYIRKGLDGRGQGVWGQGLGSDALPVSRWIPNMSMELFTAGR